LFAPDSELFGLTNDVNPFIIVNMRSLRRTTGAAARRSAQLRTGGLQSALVRDVALVCLADGIVGVSFGATSASGGLPWWVPIAMSLLVFAGGSQIAATGVVLAGGSPVAAVAAGAVLNTRLFPYGLAVADVAGPSESGLSESGPARDRKGRGASQAIRRLAIRLLGTQVITDESVAFALREADPARRRAAFWTCGLGLYAVWNAAVALGVLLGSAVKDTNAFGLDATFPAVMLALALPALTGWRTRFSAGTGAVIAVALTPVLPAGLPVIAALGGLATGWRPRRAGRAAEPVVSSSRPPTRADQEALVRGGELSGGER
jgi:predicted branched-subunit amino acid permease